MLRLSALLLLAGCGSRVEYVRFNCPTLPDLPSVTAQELAPISDGVYRNLVERELRLRLYINELRVHCDD